MIFEVEIHALCLVSKGLIGPLVHRGLAVDDTHHLVVTSRTTVACPSLIQDGRTLVAVSLAELPLCRCTDSPYAAIWILVL